jgi:hypothetical protein
MGSLRTIRESSILLYIRLMISDCPTGDEFSCWTSPSAPYMAQIQTAFENAHTLFCTIARSLVQRDLQPFRRQRFRAKSLIPKQTRSPAKRFCQDGTRSPRRNHTSAFDGIKTGLKDFQSPIARHGQDDQDKNKDITSFGPHSANVLPYALDQLRA